MTGLSAAYIQRAAIEAAKQMPPWDRGETTYRDRQRQLWQAEDILTYPERCRAQRQIIDRRPVVAADWNGGVMTRAGKIFEDAGYDLYWSDETTSCDVCGGAIDTSPHSYSHRPEYVVINECQPICIDCLIYGDTDDPGADGYGPELEPYLRSLENNPDVAVPYHINEDILLELGYHRAPNPENPSYREDYVTGFHSGQDDSPAKVLERLEGKGYDVLFRISEPSQFYTRWEAYTRDPREGESYSADRNEGVT